MNKSMSKESLITALRENYDETSPVYFFARMLFREAADTIDRLTAENARLDEELGRCTSGNGTYISLESHNRILAKQNAELLQKTQQLEAENARLTERLSAAVEDIRRSCYTCKWFLPIAPGCDTRACKREYEPSASMDCANWQWRGEESE